MPYIDLTRNQTWLPPPTHTPQVYPCDLYHVPVPPPSPPICRQTATMLPRFITTSKPPLPTWEHGPVILTLQVPPPIVSGMHATLPLPPLSPTYGRIVRARRRQRRTFVIRNPARRLRLSSRNRSVCPQSRPGSPFWITRIICRCSCGHRISASPYCMQLSTTAWSS